MRRGVSSVEFALILPLLLVFLTSIFDFGWYFLLLSSSEDAVKDATRLAVAADAGEDPRILATEAAAQILDDARLPCAGGCELSAETATEDGFFVLRSRLRWPFTPLVGLVPTPDNIVVEHTMMLEHQDPSWYGL